MKLSKLNITDKRSLNQFIDFPFKLYEGNEFWVPEMQNSMKRIMDRQKHPFYQHSEAEFFVVESEKEILGRIAVLNNNNFNAHHNSKTAFFYFFDSVNDAQVAHLLIEAAAEWAKNNHLNLLIGPKGFARSSGVGVLVQGFEILPAMGLAYNYPYYSTLLEKEGFSKVTDHLSGYMDYSHQLPEKIHQAAEKIKTRGNFWVKEFTSTRELSRWINNVASIHEKAFSDNPNFIPSTDGEFKLMADSIIQIADPRLIKLIMKGEQVAGFIIAYPNVNQAIQKTRGRIWPFGWIYLLSEKKKTKICDLNGLGITPEYHGVGANLLLYHELEKTLRKFPFEKVELVQVDERNFKSLADMENMGVNWYKRHRTYQLEL